jgi:hypothetical protein
MTARAKSSPEFSVKSEWTGVDFASVAVVEGGGVGTGSAVLRSLQCALTLVCGSDVLGNPDSRREVDRLVN